VPITYDSFGIAQDVKINFQPSTAVTDWVYQGWWMLMTLPGLGWVTQAGPHTPLSIVDYARDRDRTNVDQRFDTLLHMQYPNTPLPGSMHCLTALTV